MDPGLDCGDWNKVGGRKMYLLGHYRYHVVENISVALETPGIGVRSHFGEISIFGVMLFEVLRPGTINLLKI